MSRILTPDELRRREIPGPEHFQNAVRDVTERLHRFPWFFGAIICGSALMGEPKPWSDLDMLLMYEAGNEHERFVARDGMKRLTERARRVHHIPLSLIPIEYYDAERGVFNLTLGFLTHLTWSRDNGGLLGKDPLIVIHVTDSYERRREEAKAYVAHALETIEKGSIKFGLLSEEGRNKLCHHALDMPFHAARRVLECQGHDCGNITKKNIMRKLSYVADEETVRALMHLQDFLDAYKQEIERQLRAFNEDAYLTFLAQFPMILTEAIEFLHGLARIV